MEVLDNNIECVDAMLDRKLNHATLYSGATLGLKHLLDFPDSKGENKPGVYDCITLSKYLELH